MDRPSLGLCDICRVNEAIGVACTSIPLSVAYCNECARRGADPEAVFDFFFEEVSSDPADMREDMVTFKDGKYISYREWCLARARDGTS